MLKRGLALLCTLGVIIGCDRGRSAASGKPSVKKVIPSDARNAKVDTVIHPAPRFIDESLLGAQVGADGKVTGESKSFRQGQPIYLTMVLTEKNMNGAKVATFKLSEAKLKPGKYHVVGYWGGNIAADRTFEVVAASGKRKK